MLRLNVREHELEISHSEGEKLGERDVFGNSSFSKSHSDDSEEGLGQTERERDVRKEAQRGFLEKEPGTIRN